MFVVSPTTYMLVLEFPYWSGVDVSYAILGCVMLNCRGVHVRHVMCCFCFGFRSRFRLRSRLWSLRSRFKRGDYAMRIQAVVSGPRCPLAIPRANAQCMAIVAAMIPCHHDSDRLRHDSMTHPRQHQCHGLHRKVHRHHFHQLQAWLAAASATSASAINSAI